jgi:hypothetical protein
VKNGAKREVTIDIQEVIGVLLRIPETGGTQAIGIITGGTATNGFAVVGEDNLNKSF